MSCQLSVVTLGRPIRTRQTRSARHGTRKTAAAGQAWWAGAFPASCAGPNARSVGSNRTGARPNESCVVPNTAGVGPTADSVGPSAARVALNQAGAGDLLGSVALAATSGRAARGARGRA